MEDAQDDIENVPDLKPADNHGHRQAAALRSILGDVVSSIGRQESTFRRPSAMSDPSGVAHRLGFDNDETARLSLDAASAADSRRARVREQDILHEDIQAAEQEGHLSRDGSNVARMAAGIAQAARDNNIQGEAIDLDDIARQEHVPGPFHPVADALSRDHAAGDDPRSASRGGDVPADGPPNDNDEGPDGEPRRG